VNQADQMGEATGGSGGMPAGFPGGGFGGMPGGTSFHFTTSGPGGGGSGAHHMSPEEANAFFANFFGHDDPFGGMRGGGGGGGAPRMSIRTSMNGMPGMSMGGMGASPFSMMFGDSVGGMGGGGPLGGMHTSTTSRLRSKPPPKRYDAIPPGTVVSLKNLSSQPERNGDRGEVVEYDPSTGRYVIALEDSDEVLKVRPSNLLQHVHVTLQGIESQQELNGQRGTIIAWNNHKERYSIYVMDLSRAVSLKPANVILENGTVGQIFGLVGKPELNGKYGTIKHWIRDANRYDVQLSAEQVVRLKVENVRV
jgi:cell wall assembly regulator SMI1